MALDIIAGVLLVALVGLGYHKGALSQMAWLVAGVVAVAGAAPAGAVVTQSIYGVPKMEAPMLQAGMMVLGGAIVYVLIAGVSLLAVRFLRRDRERPSGTDRFGGALLGLGKAAIVIYIAGASVLHMGTTLQEADPADQLRLRNSEVLRLTQHIEPMVSQAVINHFSPLFYTT